MQFGERDFYFEDMLMPQLSVFFSSSSHAQCQYWVVFHDAARQTLLLLMLDPQMHKCVHSSSSQYAASPKNPRDMGTKLPATAAGGGEGNPGFPQVQSAACATLRAADAGPGAGAGPASAGEQWREHISQLALCQPGQTAPSLESERLGGVVFQLNKMFFCELQKWSKC